jgi:pimeloyl-ACP methyl ester carboxylesterase
LIPFRQDIRFARTRDDFRIAYASSGQGYPLVRAGTWMSNVEFDWRMAVFAPLFRELSARYRLYRYNPRGYGLSEGDGAEITVDTLVTDLEAVVDGAGLDRFALWGGAAAGSLASIAYAARHPERVSHLVLSAPVARGRLSAHATAEEKDRFLAFVKLIELGWGEENPAFRQILNTQMFPRATPGQMEELNELFRITTSPGHAARMAMATGRADVSRHAHQHRLSRPGPALSALDARDTGECTADRLIDPGSALCAARVGELPSPRRRAGFHAVRCRIRCVLASPTGRIA